MIMKKTFFENCFRNLSVRVNGRAGRKEFWGTQIFVYALFFLVCRRLDAAFFPAGGVAALFFCGCWLVPGLALAVRRAHDCGWSGKWLCLAVFLPLAPLLWLILAFWPGTAGPNRYDLSENVSDSRPCWKRMYFWSAGAWLLLLLGTQFQWFPTEITEETYFITEPRTPEGEVDYWAAMCAECRPKGLKPEENGWIDVQKALGEPVNSSGKVFERFSFFEFPEITENTGSEKNTERTRNTEHTVKNEAEEEKEAFLKGNPWKPEVIPEAEAWVEKYGPVLDEMALAVRKPYFFIEVEPPKTAGFFFLNSVPDVREMASMFCMRAYLAIEKKDPERAVKDILTVFLLARRTGENGNLINYYTAMRTEERAGKALRTLLFTGMASSEQLTALETELNALPPPPDFRKAMRYEMFGIYSWLQAYLSGKDEEAYSLDDGMRFMRLFLNKNIVRKRIAKNFQPIREMMAETDAHERLRFLPNYGGDALCVGDEIYSSRQILFSALTIQGRSRYLADPFSLLMMDAWLMTAENDVQYHTNIQLIRVAVTLERYRSENGKYPETLEEIGERYGRDGSAPLKYDPWTGRETLHYSRNPQSYDEWKAALVAEKKAFFKAYTEETDGKYKGDAFRDAPAYESPYYLPGERPYYRPYILYRLGKDGGDDGGVCREGTENRDQVW